ncbi:hypothetical protein ACIP5Y_21530 [Nocardia sp. NPDC088792]|uniref:hypothetical protein n=1 Tax=Nocardia sp. NPDC088792 TaxID=3364332 RepID=UPI0037FE31A9
MGQTAIPAPQLNTRAITDPPAPTVNIMPADDTISKAHTSDAVPNPSGPAVSIVGDDGSM